MLAEDLGLIPAPTWAAYVTPSSHSSGSYLHTACIQTSRYTHVRNIVNQLSHLVERRLIYVLHNLASSPETRR